VRPEYEVACGRLAMMLRSFALVAVMPPSITAAAASGEITSVELEPISSSPCDDAIALLDPQHEVAPPPTCKKLDRLRVPDLGIVELDRVAGSSPTGYALVLSVQLKPANVVFKTLTFDVGGCGAGTCVDYAQRSARIVRLDAKPDPAFGVEVESVVHVSHTFGDLGPATDLPEHYRLACAARAGVLDCKEIAFGGRRDDCRVIGWRGTNVRYSCTGEAVLVPGRSSDIDGIPQAKVERIDQLMTHIDRTIWENRDDCPRIVKQLDKLIDREHDEFEVARTFNTPPGKLPKSLSRGLARGVDHLTGSHTCLTDQAVQAALNRLMGALGYNPMVFQLKPQP